MKDATAHDTSLSAIHQAIVSRRSIRAFLPDPVERSVIETLLRVAGTAPSGSNIQPWQVHVVMGQARDRLCAELLAAHERGEAPLREYHYYPREWRSPYLDRRRATGWGLYSMLGIGKGDREASAHQHGRNYELFGAPVAFIFTIDRDMELGSWLDYGMFLQNIMIAARGFRLHTCPQAALANYPEIVRRHLNITEDRMVVCGMSLGHADPDAPVNGYQPDRMQLDEFVTWHGDTP